MEIDFFGTEEWAEIDFFGTGLGEQELGAGAKRLRAGFLGFAESDAKASRPETKRSGRARVVDGGEGRGLVGGGRGGCGHPGSRVYQN